MNLELIIDVLLVALLLGIVIVYLSALAGRLDRVHHRIEKAEAALDAALVRRSALCLELAGAGVLDPASALLLADSASFAQSIDPGDAAARSAAESDLTAALAEVLAGPDAEDDQLDVESPIDEASDALVSDLAAACRRVELARRFHNDAVRAARELRRRRTVRWFHLAGRTPWPETVELLDTVPEGLVGR